VLVLGTFDSKGKEYRYLIERLPAHGVEAFAVDAGLHGQQLTC
jgi:uncharacterized protein (UPF0261 family)